MNKKKLSIILRTCNRIIGVSLNQKTRKKDFVYKRSIYYQICRELTGASYERIGATINYDHASVMHGLKNFKIDVLDGINDDGTYLDIYKKCLMACKSEIKKGELSNWKKIEVLLHENINIRAERDKLREVVKILLR